MKMSASNWLGVNEDRADSPDPNRSNRYHVDNVGLQIGLGLPPQVLDCQSSHFSGLLAMPSTLPILHNSGPTRSFYHRAIKDEIQYTVDGIPIRSIYVTNINMDTKHSHMYHIFGFYGEVLNVYIGLPSNKSHSKCFGFVTYYSPKDAARVLKMRRVSDLRYGVMYVKAADSWHQPVEGPNGEICRRPNDNPQTERQDTSEEEDAVDCSGPIEAVQETKDSLNILNDDCLMHIFSFLNHKEISGVERVCKRWQALSYRMWRCLHELVLTKFLFGKLYIGTATLEQYLKRCGESLTVLDLVTPHYNPDYAFTESTIVVIARYCTNLEKLRVAHVSMGNRSLAHLARRCPHLKHLSIESCSKFNDIDLMSLFSKCSQLTHLELSHNNTVNGKCLININNPIKSLKLWECPSIQPQHLISGLQKMSSTLKTLSLLTSSTLHTKDVDDIVAAVPDLHSLSLRHSMSQFQVTAPLSLGRLTQLTWLDLSINSNVTDQVLSSIVDGCVNLFNLNLSGSGGGCVGSLTEQGLSVVGRLRKLTALNVSYLDMANNTSLTNITTRNTRLRELVCRGCPQLGDEGSSHVVSMCTELELFDLSGCDISQQTVDAALTSVKMRTNNVPLRLIVGGTQVDSASPPEGVEPSAQLTVDLRDLCEEHMRPDYFDMFFPASDSEGEDDLDHLCERLGCDCDFDYDDLYDPTLFPGDFEDAVFKFGNLNDYDDSNPWVDDDDDYDENEGDEIYVIQSVEKEK